VVHIFFVEDNPADVLVFREALRTCSVACDVLIPYDGEQALRVLTDFEFRPDLVVLDLNVPKFSGFDLLERFREWQTPVVVFTGSTDATNKRKAFALGARDYVEKPVDFQAIIKAVHAIIERWSGKAAAAGSESAQTE
jgi:DNA-binding response OmpR family regulator